MKERRIVVSCEHAGNTVPTLYHDLFENAQSTLKSHRGWDPGALRIAKTLAESFSVPCYFHDVTRLLIEPNRSLDSPQLFSEYTSQLSEKKKKHLIENYYQPYRNEVSSNISEIIDRGLQVIHISVHSFTPVWQGMEREVEIGLLFDESRINEKIFCENIKSRLNDISSIKAYYNQPYLGTDDGFTTYLRKVFSEEDYSGIEIEISQKYDSDELKVITQNLIHAINISI